MKAHERKRQSGNVLDVVPEGTPAEVVEHRLPEDERICSACGSEMVEIGKEVRRSLMMKPAEFWGARTCTTPAPARTVSRRPVNETTLQVLKEPGRSSASKSYTRGIAA